MMNNFKKSFGLRVKHFRTLLNYSQEKLAERVGISPHTISYIERGKNTISFTRFSALCNALEIEPYQLFIDIESEEGADKVAEINRLLKVATPKQKSVILNLIKDILDT